MFFVLSLRKEKGKPAEYDGVELGLHGLHQLGVKEVLTETEGAPVARAHAAQASVAEKRETHTAHIEHSRTRTHTRTHARTHTRTCKERH